MRKKLVVLTIAFYFVLISCSQMDFYNPFVETGYQDPALKNQANINAPTPGNNGILEIETSTNSTFTIAWQPASDPDTENDAIQYQVYYSVKNNINTVFEAEENGTILVVYTANITAAELSGLVHGTTYYITVVVRDDTGNKAIYKTLSRIYRDTVAPLPGANGVLNAAAIQTTGFNLTWSAATDNNTPAGNLTYQIRQSLSNNITTLESAVTNGTLIMDWTTGTTSYTVTGLNEATTYYYTVLVRDEAANIAVYTMTTVTTADSSAPVPGNTGLLQISGIGSAGFTLSWTAASDDTTPASALVYQVLRSDSGDIDTVLNAQANGTVIRDWTANLTTQTISGLTEATTYYVNVLVRDTAGLIASYTMPSVTTNDTTIPVPGNTGALSTSNLTTTGVDLAWTAASDNSTLPENLEYRVMQSDTNNIATLLDADTNGTVINDWSAGLTSFTVTGLNDSTTYYFTVIVRDAANNRAIYNTATITTPDSTAPVPGASGVVTTGVVTSTGIALSWTKASDNDTVQANLEYLVVRSLSANLGTVADAEANGTVVMNWAQDYAGVTAGSLTDGVTYYLTVVVRDEAGNKAVYTTAQATTLDVTPPTPGNTGLITVSDITKTGLKVAWSTASDNKSPDNTIVYKLVTSLTNNIATPATAEANGTLLVDYSPSITEHTLTGLSSATTYYYTVLAKDEAGNIAAYTMKDAATLNSNNPVPGNTGVISAGTITAVSAVLNWTEATDDLTPQANLEYQVYQSASNTIDTVANIEANGTIIKTWIAASGTFSVSGLTESTTYYFNVIVRDENQNKSAYSVVSVTTSDITPPAPGGVISGANHTTTTLDISWPQASDAVTDQSVLEYILYRSVLNNIGTEANAIANGTVVRDWNTYVASFTDSGLTDSVTYYYNVLVRDAAGNVGTYTMQPITTVDGTDPVAGNGNTTIATGTIDADSIELIWAKASDLVSLENALEYRVVSSTTNNIGTLTDALNNGSIVRDWNFDYATVIAGSLTDNTTYYFNVLVRDEAGNMATYTSINATTLDGTPPTPGSGGVITVDTVTSTTIDISWAKATDTVTAQTGLEYLVVYSPNNDITTPADAELNGTEIVTWTTDITTAGATGLTDVTLYYFNVIVRDAAGNKAAYDVRMQATGDGTPPTLPGGNTITPSSITADGVTLTWAKADDTVTAQTLLEYKVVYSTTNNITTALTAEANGTDANTWTADITTFDVTGLLDNTTHYFNVLVRDGAGNVNVYGMMSIITLDGTAPTLPGGNTITPSSITADGVTLTWAKADDTVTAQTLLEYKVVYSTSNNVADAATAEANGTDANTWTADIATFDITGLNDSTLYYFNVLVRDGAGNVNAYAMMSITTTDGTAPTLPGGSTITPSSITADGVTLTWSKASDTVTAQTLLEYKVVYSTTNNVADAATAEANGTDANTWTADIATFDITGLNDNTTYYLNVIVRDQAGNTTGYTMMSITTLDGTPPTLPGGNTITPSSITADGVTLTWAKASDTVTAQTLLEYKVVYSTTNNVVDAATAEANGTDANTWTADIATFDFTGLNDSTLYYFNVLVRDATGNVNAYAMMSITTLDGTAPTLPGGATITPSSITADGVTLTWAKASDTVTAQTLLEYKVVYSTTNNIADAATAEANGTDANTWTDDIATFDITGLNDNTLYYFNVMVRDAASNVTAYTMMSITTTDGTAPTLPGGSTITPSSITADGVTLTWAKASDTVTAQTLLEYKVVYSTSNNIADAATAEANGTDANTWTADIATFDITGLNDNTLYYFNVIVRDGAANVVGYTMMSITTLDGTAPTLPGGSTITPSSITADGVTLTWAKASDTITAQTLLEYKVVYSTGNNIADAATAEANGTDANAWTADIATFDITGLNDNTLYYLNVMVRDAAGNVTAYTMMSITTLDGTAPTLPGGSTITPSSITADGVTLTWSKASDTVTAQTLLEYKVVYSTTNNVADAATAEANGTDANAWTADIATFDITGLNDNTLYYFNVLVRDAAGNVAAYTMMSITTADGTAPTLPGGSTITPSSITADGVTLTWAKASDTVTAQTLLEYKVVYSTSSNIADAATAEANGTDANAWTADIATFDITGLNDYTTYYCNVLVRDAAGNVTAYTMESFDTLDGTAPTFPGGSTITPSSITADGVTLTWAKASDTATAQSLLEYKVVYSTGNNIADAATAEANGTDANAWTADIATFDITGLNDNTLYYLNILVRDAAGNVAVYTMMSITTADGTAPTLPGGSTITSSSITADGVTLTWAKASDTITAQTLLEYKVVYSTTNNVADAATAEANGTDANAWTADIATFDITGLNDYTTYYCNVLVRDAAGNVTAYTMESFDTLDGTAPTFPGGSTIGTASITATGVTLSWSKASDTVTAQSLLEYKVVYSTSTNIADAATAEANGTDANAWTADIATFDISGLNDYTTYYCNVLVRDAAGNVTAYTMESFDTLDGTAPTFPGGSTIGTASITSSGVNLSWSKASDTVTTQTLLEYKVVQSSTNNIADAATAEANGTDLTVWTADLAAYIVSGLTDNTTYYFNVLVRDAAGNVSAYTMESITTLDGTPPLPGASGTLTPSGITASQVTLTWSKASDLITAQTALEYRVYRSSLNDMDTVNNAENNGTALNTWSADISTYTDTLLTDNTTYYYTVIVRDAANNKAIYDTVDITTLDGTAPTLPGGSTIGTSSITASGVTLSWSKASDTVTAQTLLEYKVVYSTTNNVADAATAEANGTDANTWTADIATFDITGLNDYTTYYCNVLVRDAAGNVSAYTMQTFDTLDGTPPTFPGGSTIGTASITSSGVTLSWSKASDTVTAQTLLEYKVVYSTTNNVADAATAEANGTDANTWTADIATFGITGLNDYTTYYCNVLVRDAAGNVSAYTMQTFDTLDGTPPLPGSTGTITPSGLTASQVTLTWSKASDLITAQTALEYRVYRSSLNDMDTVNNAETNGTALNAWSTDITTYTDTSLTDNTTYYYTVIVRDAANNKAIYSTETVTTPDGTPPTLPGGDTIIASNESTSTVDLSWSKADDTVTSQTALEYLIVYSTSDNITSATDAETNGTEAQTWTTDIALVTVGSLTSNTLYYFNVVVRDAAGNKTAYAPVSTTTLNPDAPSLVEIITPTTGATNVPINTNIVIRFNESMSTTDYGLFTIGSPGTNLVHNDNCSMTFTTTTFTNDTVTINPYNNLAYNTVHATISVSGFKDVDSNTMNAYGDGGYTFTTEADSSLMTDSLDGETTGSSPANFNVTELGGTVSIQEVPSATNKSICFADNSNSNAALATRLFTETTSGTVTFEVSLMALTTTDIFDIKIADSSNQAAGYLSFASNGQIRAYNNGGQNDLMAYTANTWYDIKIVADLGTSKYDVYVNNESILTGSTFFINCSALSKIILTTSATTNGTYYADNIRVY